MVVDPLHGNRMAPVDLPDPEERVQHPDELVLRPSDEDDELPVRETLITHDPGIAVVRPEDP